MSSTKDNKHEMLEIIKQDYGLDIDINESWTTSEVTEEFNIESFLAPFCFGTNKETGAKGSLTFIHHPRIYYAWQEA